MQNVMTIPIAGERAVRYDSPWRRLKWTGPTAILIWLSALWALSLVMAQGTHKAEQPPPIEARFIELPEPPVVPPPPVVHPVTPPTPAPIPRPQKQAAPLATATPTAAEPSSAQSAPVETAQPSAKPQQNVMPGVAAAMPNSAPRSTRHPGLAVRQEAEGLIERPPGLSVMSEENTFDLGQGEGLGLGGLMQEFSDERDPATEVAILQIDRPGFNFFTTPPRSWCFDANPFRPYENGSCPAAYDKAVAAYKRKDYVAAFAEFKRLAELRYEPAQYSLGLMYADGIGMPKDDQQAVYWYQKAAKDGEPRAVYNLALMYSDGRGVPKDDKQAAHWYRKAAYYGNPDAQYNLGVLYALGTGVPKDDKQAMYWYRKAADRGNVNAQYNLGAMYAEGMGVPQDNKRAVYWHCKATSRGDAKGHASLTLMYGTGAGAPSSDELAYFCWLLTIDKRSVQSKAMEHHLYVEKLTREQRANALAAARAWKKK